MTPVQTTVRSLYHSICNSIANVFDDTRESESTARLLLEHYLEISYTDIILNGSIIVNHELNNAINIAISRLNTGEPIQYILGYTYFLGRKFTVNSSVLIPRPETEELVHHIIKYNKLTNLSVLDIGTGSGCISISLKKELPAPSIIHAIDIHRAALDTAAKNAVNLDAEIFFIEKNILEATSLHHKYDIVVSNPPYVLESEKEYMNRNVLNYEPPKAIFVPTHDPLIFYRKIVELAKASLNPQGKIYFEINQSFGNEISTLLQKSRFTQINILKDLNNKERIVEACMQEGGLHTID
jgi:release factor glutamine methyltransferase